MDVDKILSFRSTLGWHSLMVNGEVQRRKGLWWIPRHPEMKKGVANYEMLRGVESKHRSGDSQIAKELTYMYVTEMCLSNSFGISSSV